MKNSILYRPWAAFSRLGWVGKIFILIVIAICIGGIFAFARKAETAAPISQNTTPTVELSSVANLSQGGSTLSIVGTVQSQTEATVRAEKSGEVTSLNYSLGSSVSAGSIVAEIENASERAALLQATGALQAAQAGANVSQTTLTGAQNGAVSALLSAYGAIEKSIHTDIDPMFSNPETLNAQITMQTTASQAKIDAQNMRLAMGPILSREQSKSSSLSASDDLLAEMTKTENELRAVRDFLDTVTVVLNSGIADANYSATTIATYRGTATGARSTITSALSAVTSAHQALQTSIQSSAQGTDVTSSAQAAITQAQGALAAAKANLEKSVIRAPISGTINSLSLKMGDFAQMGSPVLTVANNHALEVIAYITGSDANRIAVGDKAKIDADTTGTITKIAPAIDPTTKKIEVRVGLPANANVVNGQSVVLDFIKPATTATKPSKGPITIPLSTLKIGSENIVVFTVDENNKLVPHEVKLGTLMGDRVVISSGLTTDMIIVTDARGLQEGQQVNVKQ
jgi:RND family efflux transporter MFP subunit